MALYADDRNRDRPIPRDAIMAGIAGAASGLIATIPMTAAMLIIQRLLPRRQQTKLEPRKISDALLKRADLDDDLNGEQKRSIALASHFAYGTSVGMMYPAFEKRMPVEESLRGPAFGLGVWAASYLGWLPAAGILPPPQRRPAGRNLLLIAAHLIWGAALHRTYKSITAGGNPKPRVGDSRESCAPSSASSRVSA